MDLRYVIADVFTDTPLAGNAVAVFTDGSGVETDRMQKLARETNLSETVFVSPTRERRARAHSHLHARPGDPVRGPSDAGNRLHSRRAAAADRDWLETGRGIVPVALEREGARIIFGWMEQPILTVEPYAGERELLEAARHLRAPSSRSRSTTTGCQHVYVTLCPRRTRWPLCVRT